MKNINDLIYLHIFNKNISLDSIQHYNFAIAVEKTKRATFAGNHGNHVIDSH